MDYAVPRLVVLLEKLMWIWISNTPQFMQPKFFWNLYFKLLDTL